MSGQPAPGPGALLRVLRTAGPSTRQQLVTGTGLTRTQVDGRLESLRALGLVQEAVTPISTGGRRPRAVALNSRAGHVLTLCIGATGVLVASVDLAGDIIDERRTAIDVARGPHDVLGLCVELAQELSASAGADPWAVGVSVPGPVDIDRGIVLSPPIMPGWDQFPIRDWVADKLQTACWLDNDANACALGEFRHGAGRTPRERSSTEMVYVHLGTGIGAGIIMSGALQRGDRGCAGDIGHLPSPGATVACRCGNVGCLEAVAGGSALGQLAQRLATDGTSPGLAELSAELPDGVRLDASALSRAAELGDAAALGVLRTAGTQIGEVLASVISLLNPGQLVIGGGLSQSGDLLLSSVRKSLYARALPLASRDLLVRRATLGDLGAVHGLAELALEGLFSAEVLDRWMPNGSPQGKPGLSGNSPRK